MSGLNWSDLLHAGLHRLRLNPEEFWRLTPAELRIMLGQSVAASPMGRSELEQMMAKFPDEPKGERCGRAG